MKWSYKLIFIILSLMFSLAYGEDGLILESRFHEYQPVNLEPGYEWPGEAGWITAESSGVQALVKRSIKKRDGIFFEYCEEAAGQSTSFSYISVGDSISQADEWRVKVDFLVRELRNEGFFGVISLYNRVEDILKTPSRLQALVASVTLKQNVGDQNFQVIVSSRDSDAAFRTRLVRDTWYTIEIMGRNSTQELTFTLHNEEGLMEKIEGKEYRKAEPGWDVIAIGDVSPEYWNDDGRNQVYLDRLIVFGSQKK